MIPTDRFEWLNRILPSNRKYKKWTSHLNRSQTKANNQGTKQMRMKNLWKMLEKCRVRGKGKARKKIRSMTVSIRVCWVMMIELCLRLSAKWEGASPTPSLRPAKWETTNFLIQVRKTTFPKNHRRWVQPTRPTPLFSSISTNQYSSENCTQNIGNSDSSR